MDPCLIRSAAPDDAEAAVGVLRDSITQLCVADHQNDSATLDKWLRNKTPGHFVRWLASPESYVVVAEVGGRICGVGSIRKTGDLDLCYVQPGRQRSGIGRAILDALEAEAAKWGLNEVRLISTATGRAFYERHGYLFL